MEESRTSEPHGTANDPTATSFDEVTGAGLGRRAWLVVRWTYRRLRDLSSQAADLALGVRTTVVEPGGPFAAVDERLIAQRACGWLTALRAFGRIGVRSDDVLLDVGSGTGRILAVASLFPFRRVVGLVLDVELHRAARANTARLRWRRAGTVEVVHGDATAYEVPDDVTVVFLYNPFVGRVFERCMERVFESLDRSPRKMVLIYVNPKEHACLVASGRCRLVERLSGMRPTREWAETLSTHIYRIETNGAYAPPRVALERGRKDRAGGHNLCAASR